MASWNGKSNNPKGKPKGTLNRATIDFKLGVNKLIEYATPQMTEWLMDIPDPAKRLEMIYKFAQFGYPLLARTEMVGKDGGDIKISWEK